MHFLGTSAPEHCLQGRQRLFFRGVAMRWIIGIVVLAVVAILGYQYFGARDVDVAEQAEQGAQQTAEAVGEAAEKAAEATEQAASDAAREVEEAAERATEEVTGTAEEATQATEETAAQTGEAAQQTAEQATAATEQAASGAAEEVEEVTEAGLGGDGRGDRGGSANPERSADRGAHGWRCQPRRAARRCRPEHGDVARGHHRCRFGRGGRAGAERHQYQARGALEHGQSATGGRQEDPGGLPWHSGHAAEGHGGRRDEPGRRRRRADDRCWSRSWPSSTAGRNSRPDAVAGHGPRRAGRRDGALAVQEPPRRPRGIMPSSDARRGRAARPRRRPRRSATR